MSVSSRRAIPYRPPTNRSRLIPFTAFVEEPPPPSGPATYLALSNYTAMLASDEVNKIVLSSAGGGEAPWTPADLSPVGLYNAKDTGTITASGGAVSQVSNQAGSGGPLLQASGGSQPSTGTRTINGNNVLDFDGSNDVLVAAISLTGTAATVFWAGIVDAASNERQIGFGDGSNTDYSVVGTWAAISTDGSTHYAYNDNALRSHATRTVGTPVVLCSMRDGTASSFYKNGAEGTSDAAYGGSNFAINSMTLMSHYGASAVIGPAFTNGAWAATAVFDRALTSGERAQVNTFFMSQLGI